jgi:prepilin-type N-terminal cleavage/methylation domain-containing protein
MIYRIASLGSRLASSCSSFSSPSRRVARRRHQRLKPQTGFTIVELLVVIVVIGILAAITIIAYNGIQARAQASAVSSALDQTNRKLALYLVDNSAYPPDLATAGINNSGATSYQYSFNNAVSPQTYCVTATDGTTSYFASSTTNTPASGGCPGHGVGGVAAITNLSINPRALNTTGWGSNNPPIYPVTRGVAISGHPIGIATAARSQLAAGQVSTCVMSVYNIDTLGNSATSRTIGLWVYVSAAGYYAYIYLPSGSPTKVSLAANTWTFIQSSAVVTGYGSVAVCKTSGNADPADYAYITGTIVVAGTTVYNFADGDSANWVWNGTPNNSTSTGPAQ